MTRKEVEILNCKASRANFLQDNIDILRTMLEWYQGNETRMVITYGGNSAEISNETKDKMIDTIKDSISKFQDELDSMNLYEAEATKIEKE